MLLFTSCYLLGVFGGGSICLAGSLQPVRLRENASIEIGHRSRDFYV